MSGDGHIENNIAVKGEFNHCIDDEEEHTDILPANLSFNAKINEKNMQLLADNDAMDAHMKNLFQNYFWKSMSW